MVSARDAMLAFSTYVFPLAAFPLLAWGFAQMGGWRFALVALGVPLLFGYALPAVGVGLLRRWRFTSGPRIGGIYAHHGVIYSAKLGFVLFLAMREPALIGLGDAVGISVLVGAAAAYGGWLHDVHAIKAGRIELLDVAADARTPEEAVTRYAPAFFWLGATYAAVTLWAHRVLVLDGRADALPWVFAGALLILVLAPSAAFLALARARPAEERIITSEV